MIAAGRTDKAGHNHADNQTNIGSREREGIFGHHIEYSQRPQLLQSIIAMYATYNCDIYGCTFDPTKTVGIELASQAKQVMLTRSLRQILDSAS